MVQKAILLYGYVFYIVSLCVFVMEYTSEFGELKLKLEKRVKYDLIFFLIQSYSTGDLKGFEILLMKIFA